MERDIIDCIKYNCGKCCEREWDVYVSEKDIKMWEKSRPDILKEVVTKKVGNRTKKLLKKKPVKFPDGTERKICIFYDFEKKCLIHEFKPEVCKKFTCLKHPLFIFQLFKQISELIEDLNLNTKKYI